MLQFDFDNDWKSCVLLKKATIRKLVPLFEVTLILFNVELFGVYIARGICNFYLLGFGLYIESAVEGEAK